MVILNIQIFGTKDASKVAGLTIRQLQYWDKSNLISPSVSRFKGNRRLWTESDLLRLLIIKKLQDAGMSVQSIRKSLNFIQSLLAEHNPTDLILVSDGYTIYAYKDTDTILDTLHAGQQVFRLTLGEVAKEMKREIEKLKDNSE